MTGKELLGLMLQGGRGFARLPSPTPEAGNLAATATRLNVHVAEELAKLPKALKAP